MDGIIAYALSKSYTDNALEGMGALAGKNCTIQSITHDAENQRNVVVFQWTDNEQVLQTETMNVPDGEQSLTYDQTMAILEGE